ncbi:hypothetical protein B0H12DRAFT_558023 [Mycena haematopus]|nr:hypothetical protein B0H12DRAFT_558023 [Mycena haematopus]
MGSGSGSFFHVSGPISTTEDREDSSSFARMGSLLGAPRPPALERRIVARDVEQVANGVHGQSASEGANANTKRRSTFTIGGQPPLSLQPPPRKRWTGTASATSFTEEERDAPAEGGTGGASSHPYANGNASHSYFSPFASQSATNGVVPIVRSGKRERPGSTGGASIGSAGGGSPSPITPGPGMYAHPHANGSAGTAGSFGVPSVRTGRVSVMSGRESIKEGSVKTYDARLSVNGHHEQEGRSTDRLSQRSVSTGADTGGRSRASSVGNGAAVNGNGHPNPNGEDVTNANGSTTKARRWSTLPNRLTPPPAANVATIPHPYAAAGLSSSERDRDRDRPPSRDSSGKGSRSSFGSAPSSSPPQTPIGEKIIQFHTQNDPSFLELSTGSTPVLATRALPGLGVPAPESEYAEIVSLPPPRRGSRQISIKEVERVSTPPPDPAAVPLPPDEDGQLFSLSRHGSAVSLGIVTM